MSQVCVICGNHYSGCEADSGFWLGRPGTRGYIDVKGALARDPTPLFLLAGRTLTCSDKCHEKLVETLIQKFGEYKIVCSIVTGECYRVPIRTIIEKGLTHEELVKFPEWETT